MGRGNYVLLVALALTGWMAWLVFNPKGQKQSAIGKAMSDSMLGGDTQPGPE